MTILTQHYLTSYFAFLNNAKYYKVKYFISNLTPIFTEHSYYNIIKIKGDGGRVVREWVKTVRRSVSERVWSMDQSLSRYRQRMIGKATTTNNATTTRTMFRNKDIEFLSERFIVITKRKQVVHTTGVACHDADIILQFTSRYPTVNVRANSSMSPLTPSCLAYCEYPTGRIRSISSDLSFRSRDFNLISLRGSEPDHKPPGLLPPRPGKSISAGIGEGFIEFDCRIWIPKWRIGARTFKDTRPEFRTFVIVPMY
ncbi:hypothetical protein V1478_018862 [Vespula squamosa]|uniref:Uncharacterized protein n=1 Tax=Vespula squamosa TaxID=30214 RepID=A0ABD1ZU09_VESSQ